MNVFFDVGYLLEAGIFWNRGVFWKEGIKLNNYFYGNLFFFNRETFILVGFNFFNKGSKGFIDYRNVMEKSFKFEYLLRFKEVKE